MINVLLPSWRPLSCVAVIDSYVSRARMSGHVTFVVGLDKGDAEGRRIVAKYRDEEKVKVELVELPGPFVAAAAYNELAAGRWIHRVVIANDDAFCASPWWDRHVHLMPDDTMGIFREWDQGCQGAFFALTPSHLARYGNLYGRQQNGEWWTDRHMFDEYTRLQRVHQLDATVIHTRLTPRAT